MTVLDSQPPEQSRLRASDADRDRVADQLREALAEGRLTPEEHAERLDAVYAAKTYAELAPIVADLPAPGSGRPAPAAGPAVGLDPGRALPLVVPNTVTAIFAGADRKGRWLVPAMTDVLAVFGRVELDLREAVLSKAEVRISISALFGGVEIKVPPGVRVVSTMMGVFGGATVPSDDTDHVNAPVIRITGFSLFGGVEVIRFTERRAERERRRKRRRLERDRRRELRAERRWQREA
jgi:hypothetical protein